MTELRPIIVFHGRHFVRHLGICNPICVKLLQAMSGVIPRNIKNDVSTSNRFHGVHKRGIHTHRHTHTHIHVDSNRRNAMRCISPKNLRDSDFEDIRSIHSLRVKTKTRITNTHAHYSLSENARRRCVHTD